MKVNKRPYPMDALVVSEKSYKLSLMTHHSHIAVSIEKDGQPIHDLFITLQELISLLMRDAK